MSKMTAVSHTDENMNEITGKYYFAEEFIETTRPT